ncbi:uncharacterized protein [Parasteatoda tepidariorum]|uniref:uncharacterized protein n=1 Tax=Parasteatoda tepidariorum TaxID=114398 RepID=UPI00077FD1F8|nr:uncharacterized protein LOC107447969 [Parasteatoda tepidariorum]
MEGNEMNVFSQVNSGEVVKGDHLTENISRQNKGVFGHFVEESTLRNVSLDELEEVSEVECVTDGNIRRTPSSVSSEQPETVAVLVEWHNSYFRSSEGLLRICLLTCCSISLGCVTNAGEVSSDVLDMPFSSSIRAHIFVTVFGILLSLSFFILGVTSIIESFPVYWNIIDAALHGSLCALLLFTSAMLLHAEHFARNAEILISEWTKLQLSLAAVFGFLATLICVFITITRSCASKTPSIPEDIMLTSLRSS